MPEYRNSKTGVVVSVPEALGASLRSYERVDAPAPKEAPEDAEKPAQRRARSKKSDS